MAVDVSFTVNGEVAVRLEQAASFVVRMADEAVADSAGLLLTKVKAKASGRPGPNAPTGDYRRSWTKRKVKGGYSVGTNRPQARRLEYGFYGRDSLGRFYQQQPYPHLEPAVEETNPYFLARMSAVVDAAVGSGGGGRVHFGFGGLT